MNHSSANEEVVHDYLARIFRQDPAVYDLYANDAVLVLPSGERFEGKDNIRSLIETRFKHTPHLKPPRIERMLSSGSTVFVAMESTFEGGVMRTVDVIEIADGKMAWRSLYLQDVPGVPSADVPAAMNKTPGRPGNGPRWRPRATPCSSGHRGTGSSWLTRPSARQTARNRVDPSA
jgi:ketosteroid isomerase-like protein